MAQSSAPLLHLLELLVLVFEVRDCCSEAMHQIPKCAEVLVVELEDFRNSPRGWKETLDWQADSTMGWFHREHMTAKVSCHSKADL